MNNVLLAPSLMCGDLLNVEKDIEMFEKNKVDFLHVDIMDGVFVPNIALGFDFTNALSRFSTPKNIHLMVTNPELAIDKLKLSRNDVVIFHKEATEKVDEIISRISAKCKVGIAINSATPVEEIYPYLSRLDFLHIMSIKRTGFSDEPLDENSYSKAEKLCKHTVEDGLKTVVGVDGAIGIEQIKKFKEFGVRLFVLGAKSIYSGDTDNIEKNLINLKGILAQKPL